MARYILCFVVTTFLSSGCSTEPPKRDTPTDHYIQRGLEISLEDPPTIIRLPKLISEHLEEDRLPLSAVTKYHAKTDSYTIQVDVAYADSDLSPEQCARDISSRYVSANNIPEDEYDISKTNDHTFILLYTTDMEGYPDIRVLHAHILSSSQTGRCINTHITKAVSSPSQVEELYTMLEGANITSGGQYE